MKGKKGLLAYNSRYGSVADVAYWIKALVGIENHLDVKTYNHVLTVEPYDYVIIGGFTRWEKPQKDTYKFIERFKDVLAKKELAYFLTCGEIDETVIIYMPGKSPHLSCGRSYFFDTLEKYPELKPLTLGAFGGRQVNRYLNSWDSKTIWLLGKTMPADKVGWTGLDMWESLVPERVEAFANDIRTKILSIPAREDSEKYRGYWESLQPGSLSDKNVNKFSVRPFTIVQSDNRCYFSRSRIKAGLDDVVPMLKKWADENGIKLIEEVKTYYNVYYRAEKKYDKKTLSIHIVAAEVIEDPGTVHFSFRIYGKPAIRKGAEEDIVKAEAILWADERKAD